MNEQKGATHSGGALLRVVLVLYAVLEKLTHGKGLMITIDTPRPTHLRDQILFFLAASPERQLRLETVVEQVANKSARMLTSNLIELERDGLIQMNAHGQHGLVGITEAGIEYAKRFSEPPAPAFDISKPLPHPGADALDMQTGLLNVGVDSKGEAYDWQLWDDSGAINSLIIGQTGSGLTNTLAGVIRAVARRPEIDLTVVDPVLEFRGWQLDGVGDVIDTQDGITRMFNELAEVVQGRINYLSGTRSRRWSGPADMPLRLIMTSNFPELLGWGSQLRGIQLERILRMARKVGVSIIAGSRTGTIGALHSPAIRDAMMTSNALLLRTSDKMAAPAWPNRGELMQIDHRFQDGTTTAGLGHSIDGRSVRTFWVGN